MFEKSIVKYPKRGPWGRSSWRGNTTGHIVNDFLDFCEIKMQKKIETCSDYMVGSGTTKEVCEQRGITGTYWDLSMGKNLLDKDLEIPDRPESIFFHPPYSSHIGIPYAGAEWCAEKIWKKENGKNKCTIIDHTDQYIEKYGFDPKPYDLGRMDWENFIKALNYCILKMYAALETGGRMGILMGDCRRNGKYYSMILDCAKPGAPIPGMYVKAFMDGNEVIESLQDRITGRFSCETIKDKDGNVIVKANHMITPKRAARVIKDGINENGEHYTKVKIRTILTCRSGNGICAKCYGANMATGEAVQVGESVGIIAAQSIGEPGTQLTMRTFHTGGVAGGDITQLSLIHI